jgi:tRNA threonylcarbamoyladenosine biosynthesis protein TsaB
MINLFIDTSSSRIVVALTKNSQLINIINEVNGHDLSSRALPLIDKLLKMSNTEPSAIDRIYVVNGPGSFTGIRIGVTIAKMMAWTLNKEIVTISELELLATTDFDTDYIIPWIDARRKAVFAGVYDKNGNVVEDKYIKIQDLQESLENNKTYTFVSYDDVDEIKDSIKPEIDVLKVIERHQRDKSLNPHSVNPNYLKMTEAEENLQKRESNV